MTREKSMGLLWGGISWLKVNSASPSALRLISFRLQCNRTYDKAHSSLSFENSENEMR